MPDKPDKPEMPEMPEMPDMVDPEKEPKDPGAPEQGKSLGSLGVLFGSGLQLAISVALMFFLGRWADEKLRTTPWLMIAGVLFGVGAGLYNFIKTAAGIDDRGTDEGRPPK